MELTKREQDIVRRKFGKYCIEVLNGEALNYRSQYGSVNPAAVVGPGIAATAASTLAEVVLCKMMDGKRRV